MKTTLVQPVKTRSQIADEYQINARTLRRWLKAAEFDFPQRLLTPKDQMLIYEHFGKPDLKLEVYQ